MKQGKVMRGRGDVLRKYFSSYCNWKLNSCSELQFPHLQNVNYTCAAYFLGFVVGIK